MIRLQNAHATHIHSSVGLNHVRQRDSATDPGALKLGRVQTLHDFCDREIRTSWLDRLPIDRRFRLLLPLYPSAFQSLGTLNGEVVLSSSSGWAHGVRTKPETTHVVYCHAPARWLYSPDEYLGVGTTRRLLIGSGLAPLRIWDRAAARGADHYIANSANVAERIRTHYGLEADVVHPPVEVDRFTPCERGSRLLVVSRLLRYKRIDLVIEAARRLGMALDIVGTGPELNHLQEIADESVIFHGNLEDDAVTQLMHDCNALCFPGREDFGIVAVEANAAGKPVVAFAAGGALESQVPNVTATFFEAQETDAVVEAIRAAQDLDTRPEDIAAHARRFGPGQFARRLTQAVTAARARHLSQREERDE